MADIKQCENCAYWLSVHGSNSLDTMRFCHHLLHTGVRRIEEDGVCKSWRLRTRPSKHDYYEGDEEYET